MISNKKPIPALVVRGLDPDIWLRARTCALTHGQKIADVVNAALDEYLTAQYGPAPPNEPTTVNPSAAGPFFLTKLENRHPKYQPAQNIPGNPAPNRELAAPTTTDEELATATRRYRNGSPLIKIDTEEQAKASGLTVLCSHPIGKVVGQICRRPKGHLGKHDKMETP